MQEGKGLLRGFLGSRADTLGKHLLTETLHRLASGHVETAVNRIDHALVILLDEHLGEVNRAVPDASHGVIDEHTAGAKGAQRHVNLVGLAGKVRTRGIPDVEQNLRHLVQVRLDGRDVVERVVLARQLVPALGARREHRLHCSGKAFERQVARGVKDLLGVFVARRAVYPHEYVGARQDAFSDFAPMLLEDRPISKHPLLTPNNLISA